MSFDKECPAETHRSYEDGVPQNKAGTVRYVVIAGGSQVRHLLRLEEDCFVRFQPSHPLSASLWLDLSKSNGISPSK